MHYYIDASIMEVHVFGMNATHVNVSWSIVTSQEIRVVEFTVFYSAESSRFDLADHTDHFSVPVHVHSILVKIDSTPGMKHYFQVEGTVTTDHNQSFIVVKSKLVMIQFGML